MKLKRVLEPEVMDSAEEAADYNGMDHSQVNRAFVSDLLTFAENVDHILGDLLDLGTGTALIPIELCQRHSHCAITAIDMASHMLELAERNVAAAGYSDRVLLQRVDAKRMPYDDGQFDGCISNSIIHHIPEPAQCIAEMVRVTSPGGILFVRDLMRPNDDAAVHQLVQTHAGSENVHSRQMFEDSLRAALSLQEIRQLVVAEGFDADTVQATSDRHWTWSAVKQ